MATTPEAVYDLLEAAVSGVAGIVSDGRSLENEQTPYSRTHRSYRLIPQGWEEAGWGQKVGGNRWLRERVLVRLSHKFRQRAQNASREQATADALAVWRAIETDRSLRAVCPNGFYVRSPEGPYLTDSGDFAITDLDCELVYQVSLT